MTEDRDDERIRSYLRGRGNVQVPDDLVGRVPANSVVGAGRRMVDRPTGWLTLAALATALTVAGVLLVRIPPNLGVVSSSASDAAAIASPSPAVSPSPSESPPNSPASPAIGTPFPATVLGMPVITVSVATRLHDAGILDGRDVAIGGYFTEGYPSCPAPLGYTGPLDDWCRIASFADTLEGARNCVPFGNSGVHCTGGVEPGPMVPDFQSDSLGGAVDASGIDPIPVVVIAHAADPRWWQCESDMAARCKSKLVVDRVAWAKGSDVIAVPNAFDSDSYNELTPRMTLADLSKVVGEGQQIASAVATTADGVRAFDPRWNLVGKSVEWVVRTVSPVSSDASDPSSAVTVWLIDDATGRVSDSVPLALAAEYDPARLWVTATRRHINTNDEEDTYVFYRVAGSDGAVVGEGMMGGGYGRANNITSGPDLPLLLNAGEYSLTAWLGPIKPGPTDEPIGECATSHTFIPGDDVQLEAVFDGHEPCNWSGAVEPSFGFP